MSAAQHVGMNQLTESLLRNFLTAWCSIKEPLRRYLHAIAQRQSR